MKKVCVTVLLLMAAVFTFAQITEAEKALKTHVTDTLPGWKKGGVMNINTSQTSLTNWSAGGQSTFSVNGLFNVHAHNKQEKSLWENYLDVAYGTVKQKSTGWWKTDDRIELTSKYGFEINNKLYYAALMSFKTQMTNGYNYPNDSVKISGLLAPGYVLMAMGIDYIPTTGFSIFFAPLTYKLTIVSDDALADAGSFGVEPGDHTKSEFGGYLRSSYQKTLMENVTLLTKIDLFSNYLKDFGNIDVSWETLLSMKVNKFISATLSTHLLYDDDITITKDEDKDNNGEKDTYRSLVQFKEVLAVGLSFQF